MSKKVFLKNNRKYQYCALQYVRMTGASCCIAISANVARMCRLKNFFIIYNYILYYISRHHECFTRLTSLEYDVRTRSIEYLTTYICGLCASLWIKSSSYIFTFRNAVKFINFCVMFQVKLFDDFWSFWCGVHSSIVFQFEVSTWTSWWVAFANCVGSSIERLQLPLSNSTRSQRRCQQQADTKHSGNSTI